MSELIDRIALIKALEKDKHSICSHVYGCINPCDADDLEFELEYLIYNQPTVEAKPVVHCKDCEHWGTGVVGETEHVKCCEYGKYMVGKNGYCCYADMRGGKND